MPGDLEKLVGKFGPAHGKKILTWGQNFKLTFQGHLMHFSTCLDARNLMAFLVFRYLDGDAVLVGAEQVDLSF